MGCVEAFCEDKMADLGKVSCLLPKKEEKEERVM